MVKKGAARTIARNRIARPDALHQLTEHGKLIPVQMHKDQIPDLILLQGPGQGSAFKPSALQLPENTLGGQHPHHTIERIGMGTGLCSQIIYAYRTILQQIGNPQLRHYADSSCQPHVMNHLPHNHIWMGKTPVHSQEKLSHPVGKPHQVEWRIGGHFRIVSIFHQGKTKGF